VIVLSDASPLITLSEIGYLETLPELYGSIIITPEVYEEVAVTGIGLPGALQVTSASWIKVMAIAKEVLAAAQTRSSLGSGELSTISLAEEMKADLTIIDDHQARRVAEQKGLVVFGSVGVLETAFRRGFVNDLTRAYRKLVASEAYINPEVLKASLARLGQPPL
jgi:predicted nucleic acid-binding protein